MERLVLPLESGITGIVGPNGCGKSNVVDALRWVLGETRASQLRGGTLEDVIFNGTDTLRPLGLAEVTITLRARAGDILSDLISPTSEAEQVAAGAILEEPFDVLPQGARPQLRVIDGGVSSEDPTTTSQDPKLEEDGVIPEGGLIDPAPKVHSASLLSRFSWLGSVSEVQVTRRLYRSGESEFFINKVACRLKDLKDLFRAVGLGARAYTIVAQGEVGRIVSAKPEERRLILEEAAGVLGFRDKIAEATRRLADTSQNILRIDDVILELSRQVASLKRQAARAQARQEIRAEIRSLDGMLFLDMASNFGTRFVSLAEAKRLGALAEQEVGESFADAAQAEVALREELDRIEGQADTIRGELEAARQTRLRRDRMIADAKARLRELQSQIVSADSERIRLEERRTVLVERKARGEQELEALGEQDLSLDEQIVEYDSAFEDQVTQVAGQLNSQRSSLHVVEETLRGVRDEFIANERALQMVREQVSDASPSHQLEEALGGQSTASILGDLKLLIDEIHVPEKYSRAAQAIFGERSRYLLGANPIELGGLYLEHRNSLNDLQSLTGGIGIYQAGDFSCGVDSVRSHHTLGITPLIDLLSVSEGALGAAKYIFKNVYFVENFNEAMDFFAKNPNVGSEFTLVTAEGDVVSEVGFTSFKNEGGLINLRIRERTLNDSVRRLAAEQDTLIEQRAALIEAISRSEARHTEILRESQERQQMLRELGRQQGSVRGRLEAERRLIDQADQDILKLNYQLEALQETIEACRESTITTAEEIDGLEMASESEDDDAVEELVARLASIESTRKELRDQLTISAETVLRIRSELDRVRQANNRFELELERLALERKNFEDRVCADYGEEEYARIMALEHFPEPLTNEVREEYASRVNQLRARIAREGDVDPSTIEQYETEKTRLDGLLLQKNDLEEAADTLRASLERLTSTSVQRFMATFSAVRANFSRLVPKLFGGGYADLSLQDPTQPLNTGVEIFVRPPGKKPKSIDLLSGGEKALCATALIFSMFLERPSPLCVLDEVDAPLDEANLQRFLQVVREMCTHTQFLMITHNKASMVVADTLVGVTMPTPGASRMISVSLQEAVVHGE